MGDQEGSQAQHEGRFPPRHRQQKVPGRREQQGRDQPPALPRDEVGQRRDASSTVVSALTAGCSANWPVSSAPDGNRSAVTMRKTP